MSAIVLFAWCPSAAVYVDAIVRAGASLRAVVTGAAGGAPEIAEACASSGVELWRCTDVNARGFVARVESVAPDLLLVAGCPQVLRPPMLRAARLGAVNLHPSLLPRYRGKQPLFWALLHGEERVGITAHRMIERVDAGPILLQRAIDVPARATSASLARELDRLGAELVPELLAMAAAPELPPGTPQAEPGTHFPPLAAEHGVLDFTRSADELDRLVRAATGELHAHCFHQGMKLVAVEARAIQRAAPALPGEVLAVTDTTTIAAAEGALAISRWLFLGRLHTPRELADRVGLAPPARVAANPSF